MKYPEELERTPEIVEYDRSRRWAIARVAFIIVVLTVIYLWFSRMAERYFFSAEGPVKDAFVWGFWTPIAMMGVGVGLFLLAWYTPMLRPIRVKRRQAKQQTNSNSNSTTL